MSAYDPKRTSVKRALVILVVAVGFLAAGLWASRQFDIDRCLDGGGRWDYDAHACVKTP